jgi:hypothetical protein
MHNDTIKTMMFWNRLNPSDQYNAKSRMKTSHTRKPTIEATISPIGPDFRISVGDAFSLSMGGYFRFNMAVCSFSLLAIYVAVGGLAD